MSRVIVKNLPSKADEIAIRSQFESQGVITDVKLIRKRGGASRRFAFVGFKTDAEAEKAASYLNNSYMGSSKIEVSLAKSINDAELVAHKKRRLADTLEAEETPKENINADKKDAKLEEFLSVMQPQKKVAMWKNDSTSTGAKDTVAAEAGIATSTTAGTDADAEIEDNDEDDIVDMTKLKEQQSTEADEQPEDIEEVEEEWVPQVSEEPKPQSNMSDLDWLRNKHTLIRENGEKVDLPPPEEQMDVDATVDQPVQSTKQSNRLFVRNLSYSVTNEELEPLFSQYGTIKQLHIPLNKHTDQPIGIAFCEFEDDVDAQRALENLDGHSFQGRLMHEIPADAQKSYVLDEFDLQQMPLKKQKAIKRRLQAAKQQFSWNSLYMNPDTVLESAAKKIGVSKSEIMDPTNSNMAVKQALAESSMLESIQQYFKQKNIDLNKFKVKSGGKLSDTVILVKNLPFTVNGDELQDMFAQYGEVVRTLMPPDRGIAIVQFKTAGDGRRAFQKLAFRRVGESIMYLQKAPQGVLDEATDNSDDSEKSKQQDSKEDSKAAKSSSSLLLPEQTLAQTDVLPDARTSVFIKNLNFSTQTSSIFKLFQPFAGFITAVIKMKPDPNNKDKQLSMGFGFAEFRTLHDAELAIAALQNHSLDGHKLELKISNRGQSKSRPDSQNSATTKIVIKNIPFETTKKDIVELFGTFGKLRSVRVPRKHNRQTRGFAFAEFVTLAEAEHALNSLQGAHLLGRRLVMDFAEADVEDAETEISRMEQKVAQQVGAVTAADMRTGQQRGIDLEDD